MEPNNENGVSTNNRWHILDFCTYAILVACLLALLAMVASGQSTTVELGVGSSLSLSIDPNAPPGTRVEKDRGFLRLAIYRLDVPGKLYGFEIENRGRVVWDNGGDWVSFLNWTVSVPPVLQPLRPTWHPFDGTHQEADGEWSIIGSTYPVLRHGWYNSHQPAGHGLEGRQILRVLFGEPGVECPVSPIGLELVRAYVGMVDGDEGPALSGGGVPGIDAICRQWGFGANPFDVTVRPRTAGTWWVSAHDLYPWAWQPFRGVQRLGATPGADGPKAGENARYSSPTWMLAANTQGSLTLALQVARSVASCGVVHESALEPVGYAKAWTTGMRRYESSMGDFVGDATQPAKSHNWTDDIQLASVVFPSDPLLVRTANEMRTKLLKEVNLFQRMYQTRDVDRWLSGLRAAYICTGDAKYAAHAKKVIDALFATMQPTENYFPDYSYGNGTYGISPWMDAGTLWRVIEWDELLAGTVSPAIIARVEKIIRYEMSLNTKDSDGSVITRYRGVRTATGSWTYPDTPWLTKSYYPSLVKWWVGPLWWLGLRDPSFRPTAKGVLTSWTSMMQNPNQEWVEGNVSAKTRGQAMLACLRGGVMIQDIMNW